MAFKLSYSPVYPPLETSFYNIIPHEYDGQIGYVDSQPYPLFPSDIDLGRIILETRKEIMTCSPGGLGKDQLISPRGSIGISIAEIQGKLASYAINAYYFQQGIWTLSIPIPAEVGFDANIIPDNRALRLNDPNLTLPFSINLYISFLSQVLSCWGVQRLPDLNNIFLRKGRFPSKETNQASHLVKSFSYLILNLKERCFREGIFWNPNAINDPNIQLINHTQAPISSSPKPTKRSVLIGRVIKKSNNPPQTETLEKNTQAPMQKLPIPERILYLLSLMGNDSGQSPIEAILDTYFRDPSQGIIDGIAKASEGIFEEEIGKNTLSDTDK